MNIVELEYNADTWWLTANLDDQEEEFLGWFNELDEDAKHMLHSLAIYMALGGKLNTFNVQEVGTDIVI